MKIEHISETELRKKIQKILSHYLDPGKYKFFFFGSRVRGDNTERSDIDIGVLGAREVSTQIKSKIEDELSLIPILYKIEFVDFKKVSKKFRDTALKNIEYVG